jgi:hypothetical protein
VGCVCARNVPPTAPGGGPVIPGGRGVAAGIGSAGGCAGAGAEFCRHAARCPLCGFAGGRGIGTCRAGAAEFYARPRARAGADGERSGGRAIAARAPPPGGGEGKPLKRVATRGLPARGAAGQGEGGQGLGAWLPSPGVAVARAAAPDGERPECRVVPQLGEQPRQVVSGPRVGGWARQLWDRGPTARCREGGEPFRSRSQTKGPCLGEATPRAKGTQDVPGRPGRDDWGGGGAAPQARRRFGRRLPFTRPGAEPVRLGTARLAAPR